MGETGKIFLRFLDVRRNDLQRIASATRGEYEVEDLHGVAWEMLTRIGNKRGRPIDLVIPDDQELVLRWLNCEVIRYDETHLRRAVRLDKDWDSDEAASSEDRLASLLDLSTSFDQAGLMDSEERQRELLAIVNQSYSQYSAYLILLDRFGWDIIVMAEHLRLLAATVVRRIQACQQLIRYQSSLFDRLQSIENDFVATVSRYTIPTTWNDRFPVGHLGSTQLPLWNS